MKKQQTTSNKGRVVVRAESALTGQSPRKVRLVTKAIAGITVPSLALEELAFMSERAAEVVGKTIKQAVANAANNLKLLPQTLVIAGIEVEEGPTLSRHRFGGRGRVKPYLKRMSRVKVTLKGRKNGAKS